MKITLTQALTFIGICFISICGYAQSKYVEVNIPTAWQSNEFFQTVPTDQSNWWRRLNDHTLNELINEAVANNYDLLAAANRIEAAKARLRIQQGHFYPSIAVGAAYSPQQSKFAGLLPDGQVISENVISRPGSVGLSASWEIDLIGSVRLRAKSQQELYMASKEDYNDLILLLRAQVAIQYVTLRMYQRQWQVATGNLEAQQNTVEITETRFKTGLVSALDVAQAKSLYYNTKASIPALDAAIATQINTLGILLGKAPGSLSQQLSPIPDTLLNFEPELIPVGIPADLIRRRPDLRSAERQVNAQAAALGATKTDWFPKFYINGSVGYASENFQDLFNENNLYWQITPSVKWTLFSGMQLMQNTRLARANLDQAINNFNKIILTALQEADDAMTAYSKSIEQIGATRDAYKQAKLTFDLSLNLYKKGLIDFQNVLDAQRYLLSYAYSVVSAESASLIYLIQLYTALGGGLKQ